MKTGAFRKAGYFVATLTLAAGGLAFTTLSAYAESDCEATPLVGEVTEAEVCDFDGFEAALNAGVQKIVLGADVTTTTKSVTIAKSLTLDLAGHTYTGSEPSNVNIVFNVQGAGTTFTIDDSSNGAGKIVSKEENATLPEIVRLNEGTKVVLNGGTLQSPSVVKNGDLPINIRGKDATVEMNGGKIISTQTNGYGFVINVAYTTYTGVTISINGGSITSEMSPAVRLQGSVGGGNVVNIGGGTISSNSSRGALVLGQNSGTVNISGGAIAGSSSTGKAIDLGRNVAFSMTNGEVEGAIVPAKGATGSITGGSFTATVPEELVGDGYGAYELTDDGKYTVVKTPVAIDEDDEKKADTEAIIAAILNGEEAPVDDATKAAVKNALLNGVTEFEIRTVAQDAQTISTDALGKITAAKRNSSDVIAKYYDVNAFLYGNGRLMGAVTELANEISVEIPIDESILNAAGTFYIIRYHNGVAEALDTQVVNGVAVVQSDEFSTYALAYYDVETETDSETIVSEGVSTQTTSGNNPQTLDNVTRYFVMAGVAVVVMMSAIAYLLKREA